MENASISTLELAEAVNVSVQTIRRTARELGISPQKSGKTFVFTQVQSAQIANKLRRHIQHDVVEVVAKDDVKTPQHIAESIDTHNSGLFGAMGNVIGSVARKEVTIDLDEYSDLVSKSAKLSSAQEQIELYRARIDVLEAEIERLRSDLDQAKEELYKVMYRPLSWRERLFGRPMLPEKSGD